jgi:hypothetical protein
MFMVVRSLGSQSSIAVLASRDRSLESQYLSRVRPLGQIGLGIGVGGALVPLMAAGMFESTPTPFESILMAAYTLSILAVCLSACVVPIRRALRLEPSQVLRADA